MTEDLTLKAISAYNGNLYNGMTKALEAVVAMVLEEAAKELDGWGDMYGDAAARAVRALKENQ